MVPTTSRRPHGPPQHLKAPQPQRLAPIPRTPSPGATWSRYPYMQDVPWLLPSAPSIGPSPVPSIAPSPEPSPAVYELGIPLRRLPNTCQPDLERQRPRLPSVVDAEPMDEPHSRGLRVFIWSLRILCGALALAVPAALIWFGLNHRRDDT